MEKQLEKESCWIEYHFNNKVTVRLTNFGKSILEELQEIDQHNYDPKGKIFTTTFHNFCKIFWKYLYPWSKEIIIDSKITILEDEDFPKKVVWVINETGINFWNVLNSSSDDINKDTLEK